MRSARLRHRINIERKTETRDAQGGVIETWNSFLLAIPAEIVTLQGRELLAAQSIHAGVTVRMTLRQRNDVIPAMRIKHIDKIYNIKAIISDPTQVKSMAVFCEEGMNDG